VNLIVCEANDVCLSIVLGLPLNSQGILDIQVPLTPCGHRFSPSCNRACLSPEVEFAILYITHHWELLHPNLL
jgi:hypothetical protein